MQLDFLDLAGKLDATIFHNPTSWSPSINKQQLKSSPISKY